VLPIVDQRAAASGRSYSPLHVVSAKLDANFVSTGTRISTELRLSPGQAIFAIDPFQGQLTTYDPNLSLSISQDLPSVSFLPGQWAAVVDLRNLLDQQASIVDDRQELLAAESPADRLALERRLINRELVLLRELSALPIPLGDLAAASSDN